MTSRDFARVLVRCTGIAFLAMIVTGGYAWELVRPVLYSVHFPGSLSAELNWMAAGIAVPLLIGGLFLVLKDATVADRLRLGEDPTPIDADHARSGGIDADSLFHAGATTIGLLVLLDAIGPLSRLMAAMVDRASSGDRVRLLAQAGLAIAVGLSLILGPGRFGRRTRGDAAPRSARGSAPMSSREVGDILIRWMGVILVFLSVVSMLDWTVSCLRHDLWDQLPWQVWLVVFAIGVAGFLLARRSSRASSLLSIGSEDACAATMSSPDPATSWTPQTARRTGTTLVGVFALGSVAHPISLLVRSAFADATAIRSDVMPSLDSKIPTNAVLAAVHAAVAIVLILSPGRVGHWLRSTFTLSRSSDRPATPAGEVARLPVPLDRPIAARGVATALVRVAAFAVAFWATVLIAGSAIELSSTTDTGGSKNGFMASTLTRWALRLTFGVAVFVGADGIVTWLGFRRPSSGSSIEGAWTPASALRVGTALIGGWAFFLACHALGELIRAWTGFGVPPPGDRWWPTALRPDVRGELIAAATLVGTGALLVVGARRIGRGRALGAPADRGRAP